MEHSAGIISEPQSAVGRWRDIGDRTTFRRNQAPVRPERFIELDDSASCIEHNASACRPACEAPSKPKQSRWGSTVGRERIGHNTLRCSGRRDIRDTADLSDPRRLSATSANEGAWPT